MNTSKKPIIHRSKRSSRAVHIVAPGQIKKLSNWLTEENHDINAFPDLFPNGKGGLDDPSRMKKISPVQNYNQKTLNHDPRFSEDSDFIFVAQQSLERHAFENQIAVSQYRGRVTNSSSGKKYFKTNDIIDVFKDIPGTPAYFKKFRNELMARMEQLNPFHFFITLSAAEMNWPEVTIAIIPKLGKKKLTIKAGRKMNAKSKLTTFHFLNTSGKILRTSQTFTRNTFFSSQECLIAELKHSKSYLCPVEEFLTIHTELNSNFEGCLICMEFFGWIKKKLDTAWMKMEIIKTKKSQS